MREEFPAIALKGSEVEETVGHILSCYSTISGLKLENSCFS